MTDVSGVAADAAGLSSATPTEPVPVSSVPVSNPNAYRRRTSEYPRPANWWKMPDGGHPKTCPATRHAAMICDGLRDPKCEYRRILIDAGYDPDHWASSIEVVIQGLWEARRYLKWETLPPTKRYRYNGHWVPDASAMSARSAKTEGLGPQDASATAESRDAQPSPASTPTPESI